MWTKIFWALSLLSTIIGLGGVPDDIQAWRAAMTWLSTYINCDFTGNCGRWVFVLMAGSFLGLGFIFHRRKGKRPDSHKFEALLVRGGDLLAEGQDSANLQQTPWTSRVILWDQDVRELLRMTAPIDSLMYRNIGQQPQQGQDRDIILTTLRDRRNKLRIVMGRVISK